MTPKARVPLLDAGTAQEVCTADVGESLKLRLTDLLVEE